MRDEDSLGSEVSLSLGEVPWRDNSAQSCLIPSRKLTGTLRARDDKNGQGLEGHRATPPLIAFELDVGGEGGIPVIPADGRAEYLRITTFTHFCRFVTTPHAQPLRIHLRDKS